MGSVDFPNWDLAHKKMVMALVMSTVIWCEMATWALCLPVWEISRQITYSSQLNRLCMVSLPSTMFWQKRNMRPSEWLNQQKKAILSSRMESSLHVHYLLTSGAIYEFRYRRWSVETYARYRALWNALICVFVRAFRMFTTWLRPKIAS